MSVPADGPDRIVYPKCQARIRVRYHKGDLARIEVPVEELPRLAEPGSRGELVAAFRALGFKFITLDLEGFRSGSLNAVIP
ncbi:MAG: hypothetical protein JO355_07810, partial [Planctomycetaceae bacterium]|nr:hypothetical protein [Planctomycetaceae bacterium]